MASRTAPPEDAYGRATNVERYRVLHETAARIIDDLVLDFDVAPQEGLHLDPGLTELVEVERVVRLEPAAPDAAPLTIAFTTFPGLFTRSGRWVQRAFPSCGCDACDEDPAELAAALRQEVHAVVAGNFREALSRRLIPTLTVELWGADGWSSGSRRTVRRRELRNWGGPASYDWQPWPRRRPARA